jgi:hypothetical protein
VSAQLASARPDTTRKDGGVCKIDPCAMLH